MATEITKDQFADLIERYIFPENSHFENAESLLDGLHLDGWAIVKKDEIPPHHPSYSERIEYREGFL